MVSKHILCTVTGRNTVSRFRPLNGIKMGLDLKYTLRLIGLIFKDTLRYLDPLLDPKVTSPHASAVPPSMAQFKAVAIGNVVQSLEGFLFFFDLLLLGHDDSKIRSLNFGKVSIQIQLKALPELSKWTLQNLSLKF